MAAWPRCATKATCDQMENGMKTNDVDDDDAAQENVAEKHVYNASEWEYRYDLTANPAGIWLERRE